MKWQQAGEDNVKQSFIVCNFYRIYRGDQTQEGRMGGKTESEFFLRTLWIFKIM